MHAAAKIMERVAQLGALSDDPLQLTRFFASPAMAQANRLVGSWMTEAGMTVRQDALGNLIGRLPGLHPAKILLLGSHLDTVRNAGKYDGPLGVVLTIACVEELQRRQTVLPFSIEIVAFADEEGARYQTAYLGSKALTGQLQPEDLDRQDSAGISLAEVIRQFGGDPQNLPSCQINPESLLGYVEAHIEQGPVLEKMNHAVGIVSGIAGQSRVRLIFTGQAGHAGTVPMAMRQDALAAAAEFITAVEHEARKIEGMVATVGQISAEPNVSNVIPGKCHLTLDLRHQDDTTRLDRITVLKTIAHRLAQQRGLTLEWNVVQETPAVPCSIPLSDQLRQAARRHQSDVIDLPSGAGHDAAVMAQITPVAMLFIRCAGGVSHHPDESVRVEDVQIAFDVLTDFILHFS